MKTTDLPTVLDRVPIGDLKAAAKRRGYKLLKLPDVSATEDDRLIFESTIGRIAESHFISRDKILGGPREAYIVRARRALWRELYRHGLTVSAIESVTNHHRSSIYKALKAANVL